MLERIINIAPGSDYQKSPAKSSQYHRSAHFLHTMSTSLNDSISLSPATAFLASVHWRLKKINNEKEKIGVVFEFGGFEFTASMEKPGMVVNYNIEYEVKKAFEKLSFNHELKMWIESDAVYKHSDKIDVIIQLPQLASFANKLISIYDYSTSVSVDKAEVRDSFYEVLDLLQVEFEYVNSCLVGFLEKFLSLSFNLTEKKDLLKSNLLLRKIEISKTLEYDPLK